MDKKYDSKIEEKLNFFENFSLKRFRNALIPINQPGREHNNHGLALFGVAYDFREEPALDHDDKEDVEEEVDNDEYEFDGFYI